VVDPMVKKREPYDWVKKESVIFFTECWWCGDPVYFYRNENGGCVLFDNLGAPWPIHKCWEQYKNEISLATKSIVDNRIEQLKTTRIANFEFTKSKLENIDGFIVGVDLNRRILPDPSCISNTSLNLRYVVFRTVTGEHIKLLAPEIDIDRIVKYSYATISLVNYKKNEQVTVSCLRKVKSISVGDSKSDELLVNYDYKSIIHKRWVNQTKSIT
jgi:hypothetical protein